MSKIRVHELAKELRIDNKVLIDMLKQSGVEIKSHMSTLEPDGVEKARSHFAQKAEKAETKTKVETETKGKAGEETEEPKKKKIVQVFRPQNMKNAPAQKSGSRRPQRPAGNAQGQQGQRPTHQTSSSTQRPSQQTGSSVQRPSQQAASPAQRPTQRSGQDTRTQQTGAANRDQRPSGHTTGTNQNRPKQSQQGSDRPRYNNNNNDGRRDNRDSNSGSRTYGNRDNRNNNNNNSNNNSGRNNTNSRDGRPAYNNRDNRSNNNSGNTGNRDNRGRRDDFRGDRRDDKRDAKTAATSIIVEQKPSRTKVKDKDKDHKKNDHRNSDFAGKGKKGKVPKTPLEIKKPQNKPVEKKEEEKIKQIVLPEILTIKELADKMKIVPSVIVKKLFLQGKVVTLNQEIDYDTAEEIALEFEVLCEKEVVVDVIEELLKEEDEDETVMAKRPPVVCVMGHVDHGKTSLLDAIRDTNVTDREAGGITQHIGASVVTVNGEKITFLDTPGHEAFTAMRMRGANSTDIAILVVAADDGVMPQTVEAINHAKAAGIEIVVAINKVDKPSANIDRVKQELAEYELIPEDWGGSTIFVPVSAHSKEGIPELMEMLLLTAEVMELKANPNRMARGLVIEGELDKGKGSVATVLVQKGTLHVGDSIAAGSAHGKVRAMMDDRGRRVKEAGPSMPVEILGLDDVPNAGEIFVGCENEKEARAFAETFISQGRVKMLDETKSKMSLDDLFTQIQEGNLKELGIVVKADVQGSVEALKQSLLKLSNDEVVIKIIHGGVGAINESDVSLASASNAIIIGFNVRPDATAKEIADREGVDLRLYRVIYNAIEDVEAAMKGMLDPVFEEKVLGHAEVRQTFKASGIGTIAGSYVLDGLFERHCSVRLTRDGVVVFDGPLASLKRFKDDVKEVKAGYECGFVFENYNDIKEGDLVEAYKMVEIAR